MPGLERRGVIMTFQDIFKTSFLEGTLSLSPIDFILAMVFAFSIGLFIFFIYKKTYHGIMYSESFGISLMALTMITTLVLLAVTSNIVLSLGMVGALSIVRFRTAIKEPFDLVFLYWSIAVGIVLGAGLLVLAVLGSLAIAMILYLFVNRKISSKPYIMIVQCASSEAEEKTLKRMKEGVKKYCLKSKTVTADGIEMTMEIRLLDENSGFVNDLLQIDGVKSAVLVSYNGDYMG